MNTKICTDIDQSKKLIELGLDINTADMYWSMDEIPFLPFPINDIDTDWEFAQENGMLPAWSLSALLELIPKVEEKTFDLSYGYYNNNGDKFIEKWAFSYVDFTIEEDVISHATYGDSPIDATFEMVYWLKENNKRVPV